MEKLSSVCDEKIYVPRKHDWWDKEILKQIISSKKQKMVNTIPANQYIVAIGP